ncbi:hypothetical protein [Luteolibacter luteus]|uniref:MarR family transcriptional regulator n=1 Tax=Luteolibacter luteus TaxID=2728835 RepID=A0A858RQT3_9BACT|nr:hypothetical protein [Luteolibacter luteus]QJE99105.1 hypothetical protein HHL09_26110 [Luteolibacter luteus]
MGPVELLRNKRSALVSDDEAILLLTLGQGERRPHELRTESALPERTFWRCLSACHRHAWVTSEKCRPLGKQAGRGFKTIVRLSPEGARVVGKILGAENGGQRAESKKAADSP